LLAGIRSLQAQVLLDQGRQLGRPALGRARYVEPLRELYLWDEQKHHHCGQAPAALAPAIGCAPEATQLAGLAAELGAETVDDQERWPTGSRDQAKRPEAMLGEVARANTPAIGALPRRVLGRDRQKAPAPAADHRALVERADDLRRLGVD
jgi:hypothetical protein